MLTIKALTGGENYARNHLSNNDYYAVGETVKGQWIGRGAELLGLQGEVLMEQFDAIREGVDPATGEFLRQRKSADRVSEREVAGEMVTETAHARNLYDFTVSGPKALSVQAIEDPRLVDAHKAGVTAVVEEIERLAESYVRKDGAKGTRNTGNMIIARYEHDSSRELDPQLHTHLVGANLTFDGVEGKWKALAPYKIYQQREYLTEVYRNVTAREAAKYGYEIEDHVRHGKDNGFGIVGIQASTLEKFSQRTAQKEAAVQDFITRMGRLPSNKEIAQMVRDSRPEKLAEVTTGEVKAAQRARMSPEEQSTISALKAAAVDRGSISGEAPAGPSLKFAGDHIYERVSVAKDHELYTEALRHGRGHIELTDLKQTLAQRIASGDMFIARGEVATRESLKRESQMVRTVDEGLGRYPELGKGRVFKPEGINAEQERAVGEILSSRDFAINLQGAAGTGKTRTLEQIHRGLTEARIGAVAIAPTTTAVEELQRVGFPRAMTMARLLVDTERQEQLKGQVLIVDEAGMIGSKDMSEILRIAKKHDARILFSGDTKQIKSVSEGDALRVLEQESGLRGVALIDVQRQRANREYKAAVETFRKKPDAGFELFQKMGIVDEVHWRERGPEVAKAYREAAALSNMKGDKREVLVVAATHAEIGIVTHAIRSERKAAGEISEGEKLVHYAAFNWTDAQKTQMKNYQPGYVLMPIDGPAKNEAYVIVSANKKTGIIAQQQVVAGDEPGKLKKITAKQVKNYGVFEARDIEISSGDKLLLQANSKNKGEKNVSFKTTNGELVTVAGLEDGRIRLEDGRLLPEQYKRFTHGYAVTAHRSEGKTVDFEVIIADRMANDLFYVSASRAREGLRIITSDVEGLKESIGVSGNRQSASELAKNAAIPAVPADSTAVEDLYRVYTAAQQRQQAREEESHKKEIRRNGPDGTGIGIGI